MLRLNECCWYQPGKYYRYNAGVFLSRGQAALIDPGMTFSELAAIRQFLAEEEAQVCVLMLTHFHWDHLMGAGLDWGKVRLLAHTRFGEEFTRHLTANRAAIDSWATEAKEDISVLNLHQEILPVDIDIPINLGDLRLRPLYTPGHTADHLSIFEETTGTLWAGDILSDVEIPFVSNSLTEYLRSNQFLRGLKINSLVPGHGSPAKTEEDVRQRLEKDRVYLQELADQAQASIFAGCSMLETVERCSGINYRFPAENENAHRWNTESAYVELGGEARVGPVGWQKEWLQ